MQLFLRSEKYMDASCAITITFSECVENGVGMEKIGTKDLAAGHQITPRYLRRLAKLLTEMGESANFYNLNDLVDIEVRDETEEAGILVIRNWATNADDTFSELMKLKWDTKFLNPRSGTVMNKQLRHNLCFADCSSKPDYAAGCGTVFNFNRLPNLQAIRESVATLLPFESKIYAEGNKYYDINKTGIGFHGDTERSFVVGLRLGASINLYYRWHCRSEIVSKIRTIKLNAGDVYIMSYKAVGNDWRKSSIYTLRHAAGAKLPK